jgi:hypothetical protein
MKQYNATTVSEAATALDELLPGWASDSYLVDWKKEIDKRKKGGGLSLADAIRSGKKFYRKSKPAVIHKSGGNETLWITSSILATDYVVIDYVKAGDSKPGQIFKVTQYKYVRLNDQDHPTLKCPVLNIESGDIGDIDPTLECILVEGIK